MKSLRSIALGLAGFVFATCAHALTIEGQEYLPLRESMRKLGLIQRPTTEPKEAAFTSKAANNNTTQSATVTLNQRSSKINGVGVWLNFPIAEFKGTLYLSKLDYYKTLEPLLRPNVFPSGHYKLRHIVIDAGHGGHDTGARNKRLRSNEKTLTLDVAKRLKQRLETLGYRVTLTRAYDQFVELKDRPRVANIQNADLFISIHFNAAADTSIIGAETYSYTPQGAPSSSRAEIAADDKNYQNANANDIANLWLAYNMQRSLAGNLKTPDRSARHARFVVLETLRCPGILIEGGYLSSTVEGGRLTSSLYRQQLTNAIVEGIRNYHRQIIGTVTKAP